MSLDFSYRVEPDIPFEIICGETLWSLDYCLAEKDGNHLEIQDLVFTEAFPPTKERKFHSALRRTYAVSSEELLLLPDTTFVIQGISIEPFHVDAQGFLDRLIKDQYVSVCD